MYLPGRLGLRFGGERISTRDPDRPGAFDRGVSQTTIWRAVVISGAVGRFSL